VNIVPVITRSSGLNNKSEAGTITYDTQNGVSDLASAVNVIVTDAGRIERRRVKKRVIEGEFHSIYSHASDFTAVIQENTNDAALMRINPDYSLTGLRSGLTKDKRTSFVRAGAWYFYTNSKENGVIKEDGLSYSWPSYEVDERKTREFSAAPVGSHLAFFSGCIFVTVGDTVFRSEQYEPGMFDLESFNRFSSRVIMIKPVMSGMFVSTETETLFLPGTEPAEWSSTPVLPYPAIEWSESTDYVQASRLGFDMSGNCALWFSEKGVIAGLPSGDIVNLTEEKMVFPSATKAASLLYKDKLIFNMR